MVYPEIINIWYSPTLAFIMKKIIYILLVAFAVSCKSQKSEEEPYSELKNKTDNSEVNKSVTDYSMVMIEHNVEIKPSTYRNTTRSNVSGYWFAANHFVNNPKDSIWHHVKYANHDKAFEFDGIGEYQEKYIYLNSDSKKNKKGEYFFANFNDSTEFVITPFEQGQTKHDIGDTMGSLAYNLTWINDSMIYITRWDPLAYSFFTMELIKTKANNI